jgi:hypothetical protein
MTGFTGFTNPVDHLPAILLINPPALLSFEENRNIRHRLRDRIRSCLRAVGEDRGKAERAIALGDLACFRISSD